MPSDREGWGIVMSIHVAGIIAIVAGALTNHARGGVTLAVVLMCLNVIGIGSLKPPTQRNGDF